MPDLEAFTRRLQHGERVTVCGLGDSLTDGWMVERGFFDRFVDALQERFPRAGVRRRNAGVPGSTAADGERRLAVIARENPDLTIVQFGLNDCVGGVGVDEFRRSLETIARGLVQAASLVVLATSCPVADPGLQRVVDGYYRAIHEAGAACCVPVAALDDAWRRMAGPSADRDSLFQWDGVHPTDAGHALMARGLLELFPAR